MTADGSVPPVDRVPLPSPSEHLEIKGIPPYSAERKGKFQCLVGIAEMRWEMLDPRPWLSAPATYEQA